jgi:hypothetical protein
MGVAETWPAARAFAAGRFAGFREAVFIACAGERFTEVITQSRANGPVERPIARRLRIGREIAPPGLKEHKRMPFAESCHRADRRHSIRADLWP